ncbi:MAG: PKD domain-containing protein [Flavobacteriales bacterium]|nr:PKD domain-containing protein [Flavobacteriales bacterium]
MARVLGPLSHLEKTAMPIRPLVRSAVSLAVMLLSGQLFAQPLAANAGPPSVTICSNAQTTLGGAPTASGGTGPYTYSWAPAGGLSATNVANPVCTVNGTTTYTVTVTDNVGATQTDNITVNVNAAPDAGLVLASPAVQSTFNGLTTFSLCDPSLSWNFTIDDASTGIVAGTTLSINWGDASPIYAPPAGGWSTTHTYGQGLFTITYTLTPPNGCADTEQFQVFLGTNPGGGISTDPNTNICTGGSLPFFLNNVVNNTPGTTYIIDFGDGTNITLAHPPPAVINHQYDVSSCPAGFFTVSFVAQNPCDQTNGQISPIRVSETPSASFSMSPNDTACVNTTVTFTDASLGFQAPTCTDPKNIWSIVPATYIVTSGTLGNINGQAGNPGLWTTGSNSLGIQFTAPGTYTISDLTGNVCGFDTEVRTICVEAPPTPAFTVLPLTGCVPLATTTDNTSTSANSCFTRYQWQVNFLSGFCGSTGASAYTGGTNATSFEPSINFTQAGTYQVQLQAINTCGVFPVNQTVTVAAPPSVTVYPVGPICVGQTIFPTGTFQPCGTPITGYAWTTTGGTPGTANTQVPGGITYNAAGNFTVSVSAASACGPGAVSTPLVVNNAPPSANASVVQVNVCAGGTIDLQATLIAGATYQWSGPNFFSSNLQNPSISGATAAMQGVYTVTAFLGICAGPSSTVNVVVLPAPVLTIVPSVPSICAGDNVTLTANGGSGYTWTSGGNPAGSGGSITVSPVVTTTYNVAGTGAGCAGSASITIPVNNPTVLAVDPVVIVCDQAIPVQLNANPAGGTWSGATIVNLTPGGLVTPIPGSLGNDVLTYTFVNGFGCTSTATTTVTVQAIANPANAGADDLVCEGGALVPLIGVPGGGTWSGLNVVGNSFDPVSDGVFNLTYTVGAGTCLTSDVVIITVVNSPLVTAGVNISICENALPFPLNGGNPIGGVWSGTGVIGAGPYSFDPSIANASNTLTYTWSDGNGCSNSAQITANVVPPPIANAGVNTTLCDQSIAYDLGGAPAGGTWTGGTPYVVGSLFTPVPGQLGTWTLTYTYTDLSGCTDAATVDITVGPLIDVAAAGNDNSICVNGGLVQLNATPLTGAWTPTPYLTAGGSFDPVIAGLGPHAITFCVGSGTCLSCDTRTVTVIPPPIVDAGPALGFCAYEPVQDLAENPQGGTWSGSTGITDALQGLFDPGAAPLFDNALTYTYTDPVTGCTNSDNVLITVNEEPVANFTNDPIACQNAPFAFTDLSTGNTSWQWDFGDGLGTSSSPFPVYAYPDTGTFTITLVVGTGSNCTDTITGSVTVWPSPVIDFTVDVNDGCGPLTVTFTNNSTGLAVDYLWDFGLGPISSAQFPPALSYPAGIIADTTYLVTLSGTNLCGTFSDDTLITVHPDPIAYFGPEFDTGCSPWTVTFSNVSVGQADTFEWIWGDGTTTFTNDSLVDHTFFTDSLTVTNTVTLVATNACGTDTATYDVVVQPNSITAFFNTDTTQGCAPLTVNFTQFSIGVTNWYWNLDGTNLSSDYNTSFTYTQPGTWTCTLFGDNGCSYDTVSVQIIVDPSPAVAFDVQPDSVCAGVPFQFINQTLNISGIDWDFGDSNGSTLTNPFHSYADDGTYLVTLTVESSVNECSATLVQPVVVKVTPTAVFLPSAVSGCAPLTVTFGNTSTGDDFAQWNFGDNNTSGNLSPTHTYANAGSYQVQLIAENLNGCADTAYTEVVAFPIPVSAFTFDPLQSCDHPVAVQFTNTSQGALTYAWTFGNGSSSADGSLGYVCDRQHIRYPIDIDEPIWLLGYEQCAPFHTQHH